MALIPKESAPKERPPWRGVVVGAVAALVFVLVLAVSAWATRDTPRGVPEEKRHHRDAGVVVVVDAGVVEAADAGFVDAGSNIEGPATEPDAGPQHIAPEGPPVSPKDVAALVAPVVEQCLKAALRFDPSLGGKATVKVVVGKTLAITMPGAPSPVLASCVAGKRLAFENAPVEPVTVQVKLQLDGLRGAATVLSSDLVP